MSITVVPWYLQDEDHFLCRLIFLFFFFICGKSFYCSNFLVLVLEFLTVFLSLCCRRRICPSSSSSPSNLAAFKKNSLLNGIHFCSSRGDGGHRPLPSSPGEESVLFQVCRAASRSCVLKFIWIRSDDSSVGWLVAYTFVATILSCFSFCWNLSPGNILGQALGGKSLLFLG